MPMATVKEIRALLPNKCEARRTQFRIEIHQLNHYPSGQPFPAPSSINCASKYLDLIPNKKDEYIFREEMLQDCLTKNFNLKTGALEIYLAFKSIVPIASKKCQLSKLET